jgi:hypothetical protein
MLQTFHVWEVYPHDVVNEFHFSYFKNIHLHTTRIQVQKTQQNNKTTIMMCVHVFMCVTLIVLIMLGANLVTCDIYKKASP